MVSPKDGLDFEFSNPCNVDFCVESESQSREGSELRIELLSKIGLQEKVRAPGVTL